jgi:hypothetical protein
VLGLFVQEIKYGLPLRKGPTIVHNIGGMEIKKAEFNKNITCSEVLMVLYKHS